MTDTAVITGASAGIGAAYADRFARRGYDLLLVARNEVRLEEKAAEIRAGTGRAVEVLAADLADPAQLAVVEKRLRTDSSIDVLVNNVGAVQFGSLAGADTAALDKQIALNITALTRLSSAAATNFTARGRGTIINLSSALAINILPNSAVYSATKSYGLTFTLGLHNDLADKGIRVQAVLPGAVGTGFWDGSGVELEHLPAEIVMSVDDAVDAALAGLDSGELVTIPSLPDVRDWEAYLAASATLQPNLSLAKPAERYRL
jgi:short-subunit dehydrogenase